MSNKITDRIELLATLESCPRHLPVMQACTYADGQACECRQRATSWYWPVLIGLGMVASIVGYFFLFVGLGVVFLFAVIVVAAVLANRGG